MSDLLLLADRLRAAAMAARQRRALVLAGGAEWARRSAGQLLLHLAPQCPIWIGRHAVPPATATPAQQATRLLGSESDLLVFDAHDGFDADAFGAVVGTLTGGGLLLLLTPPLAQWPAFSDPEYRRIAVYPYPPEAMAGRFLRRLARIVAGAPGVTLVEQDGPVPLLPPPAAPAAEPTGHGPFRTEDQARAVAAILKVAQGHRRRPAVLTSDRGRGKSAALGIAAARLLEQGMDQIVVTGPRLDAVAPVFEHAARLLPAARASHSRIEWHGRSIRFAPPDELALTPARANLLLVDEAAAIPTPLLERLLAHHSRIAFASTVHGYEGTGRGFAVRFQQVLDRCTPGWQAVQLSEPVRWAAGDPIEDFSFRALLLDAAAAEADAVAGTQVADCRFERLDRDALLADEPTLSQLFGLLVTAHYRTRPSDLRHLLDGPNLQVWVARAAGRVVATLLLAAEGGFAPDLSRQVWQGRTRPHGHLLPEALAAHLGLEAASRRRLGRVIRIAVHPALQGRGIGSALLEQVVQCARREGLDAVGSSFGATAALLHFWERAGLRPVRLSIKRGATSGEHSAIVLRALTADGEALVADARNRFRTHLPHWLADPLSDLEPELVTAVLRDSGVHPPLSPADWQDLVAFAFGRRVYEDCMGPVHALSLGALADGQAQTMPERPDREAVIAKVLQHRDYAEVARRTGLTGRAEVVAAMRRAVAAWVLHYGEPWVVEAAGEMAAAWGEASRGD